MSDRDISEGMEQNLKAAEMKSEVEIREEIRRCSDAIDSLPDEVDNRTLTLASMYSGKVTALRWVLGERSEP